MRHKSQERIVQSSMRGDRRRGGGGTRTLLTANAPFLTPHQHCNHKSAQLCGLTFSRSLGSLHCDLIAFQTWPATFSDPLRFRGVALLFFSAAGFATLQPSLHCR